MSMEQPPEVQRVRTRAERGARSRGTAFYVLVVVTAALVLNAIFGDSGMLALIRKEREYRALSAELARAQAENARLQEAVRKMSDDPATIEDLARRKLGLIRRGEKLFIIHDVEPSRPPGSDAEPQEQASPAQDSSRQPVSPEKTPSAQGDR
jgi:cell division protein FtsB